MAEPVERSSVAGDEARESPVRLIVAWLVVGVPLAWGVSQTIAKSAALFAR